MHVALPVQEGERLQHVSGTVLDEPQGVSPLGSANRRHGDQQRSSLTSEDSPSLAVVNLPGTTGAPHQQIRHADVQELQQQTAGGGTHSAVVGEHAVQSH